MQKSINNLKIIVSACLKLYYLYFDLCSKRKALNMDYRLTPFAVLEYASLVI